MEMTLRQVSAVARLDVLPALYRPSDLLRDGGIELEQLRSNAFRQDAIGPKVQYELVNTSGKVLGWVVVDNITRGPAIGGTRIAPAVSLDEVSRLARAMTFKNAAAQIPHGGAKAGLLGDPVALNANPEEKKIFIQDYARAIAGVTDYIPGPDMGTNETDMQTIFEITDRAAGRPKEKGGIPLDELGLTGLGLVHYARATATHMDNFSFDGASVLIEGYGNVGRGFAKHAKPYGVVVRGISDVFGTFYNKQGLDTRILGELVDEMKCAPKKSLATIVRQKLPGTEFTPGDTKVLQSKEADIFLPAARGDTISSYDAFRNMKVRLVLEGANIPATQQTEVILWLNGIWVAPDFMANCGGVIGCAEEVAGHSIKRCIETVKSVAKGNAHAVAERALNGCMSPRTAAYQIALERLVAQV